MEYVNIGDEYDTDQRIRIETYKTKDIAKLVKYVWQWNISLNDLDLESDKKRVKIIMDKIPKEGKWPYISHWARDMEGLMEVDEQPNGEISVPNHGDGWHRIIAHIELKLPTIDIVFFIP